MKLHPFYNLEMTISPREQLLKMQRIILRQLKASVHKLQGAQTAQIVRYYKAYKREFRDYQKISNKAELIKALRDAQIIFGGDFHAFAQSQRTHLRILRDLIKGKRSLILALEAIESQNQKHIDNYLQGHIDDETFLKRINYSGSWGFPWSNYKVLFDFAKAHKIPVKGINLSGQRTGRHDLNRRDSHSATEIVKIHREDPKALVYVIYGDLHLASSHLPKLIKRHLNNGHSVKTITIFQNSESLYWRLAKKNLEEKVDVLKLRSDAYCIVNSPPWLKWQAYLQFLENSVDADKSESKDFIDYSDHIFQFINLIKDLWGIKGSFADYHVYSSTEVKFAEFLGRSVTKRELKWLAKFIQLNRSFFISNPPIFYLTSVDVNHVAALAGQYIHSKLRREKGIHCNFPQDFTVSVWLEAVGFFSSKLVNSRRKFNTIKDLPVSHQATLIVLEQKLREAISSKTQKSLKRLRPNLNKKSYDYYEASRIMGAQLGNKMYLAFRNGKLDRQTLHYWLKRKVEAGTEFSKFYMDVIKFHGHISAPERSKNERL